MENISKEAYDKLANIFRNPGEYFEGKVCSYPELDRMDNLFLFDLDKDYLKDYFLVKDWVKFSFYNGTIFEKFFKNEIYKDISIENIKLIWGEFNKNKKEILKKNDRYYHEKRFQYITKIASLLIKKSRKYDQPIVLSFLKELVINIKEEKQDYSLARDCAKLMGDYFIYTKEMNADIFNYLKEQQNIERLNLHLIFYDWQILKINQPEKIKIIIDLIREKKPEITDKQIIKEALEKNSNVEVIKYIHESSHYNFEEEELNQILRIQKSSYSESNVKYIIENFKPTRLVGRSFSNIYNSYKYSSEVKEKEFYNNSIEYLKRKISYEELNEKIPLHNLENKKTKI